MTWFKVDDSFHSHPKVLATDPAALGLWVLAGSWSSAHLTEGVVRDDELPRLLPDAATLARKLVAAGLWKRIRGGYQFHDWADRNPTKKAVTAERKANAERQRRWREAQRNGSSNGVTNGVTNGAPTRPDPSPSSGSSTYQESPSVGGAGGPREPRGTRLPDPFEVTDEMRDWARTHTPTCGAKDHEAFVDYWRGQPGAKGRKVDWFATWRNWMRREQERRQSNPPRASPADPRPSTSDQRANAAKDLGRRLQAQADAAAVKEITA
jgi:hypothetical protein